MVDNEKWAKDLEEATSGYEDPEVEEQLAARKKKRLAKRGPSLPPESSFKDTSPSLPDEPVEPKEHAPPPTPQRSTTREVDPETGIQRISEAEREGLKHPRPEGPPRDTEKKAAARRLARFRKAQADAAAREEGDWSAEEADNDGPEPGL